ncbi:MAG: T9SS type A sorting domain-containing protein [Bacteroidetes bacterium]|nr:T9SS type A sorting domain-containing protein [Bacteroidota bacterium]
MAGAVFNGNGKFTKTGTSNDNSGGGCTFNGTAEFTNAGTGSLSLDYTGADAFNGDVRLNNTSSGSIFFGQNGGTATLAAGSTIAVGSMGFAAGLLCLRNFTQVGTMAQNIVVGSGASLYLYNGSTFNGDLNASAGSLFLWGTTFNGAGKFTKTGASTDFSPGGCTYNGPAEFIIASAGHLGLAYSGTDLFNNEVRVNSTSTGMISTCYGSGTATLAAGRTIAVGALGFPGGTLYLRNFTQLGTASQSIMLGDNATMYFKGGSTFNGNTASSAGNMYLDGTVFNGTGWFRKTGPATNNNAGGNVFNGTVELLCTGAGQFHLDYSGSDVFNADLLLNNTGSGGIFFGTGSGTATLGSAAKLGIGSLGFTNGTLQFKKLIKLGSSPAALAGTAATTVNFMQGCMFNGDLVVSAGNLQLWGGTFNRNCTFTKMAAASNSCYGGNTFNGDAEFNNYGQLSLAVNMADTYMGNAIFRRLGAGSFIPVYNYNASFARDVSTVGSTGTVLFGNGTSARTIFNGSGVQVLSSDAAYPPTVRNLDVSQAAGGELQLAGGDVNVSQSVAFNSGIIKPMAASSAGPGLLVMGYLATISQPAHAGSHVDGFMRKEGNTAFTFPVGNAGILAPVSIGAPASIFHHFTAKYVRQDPHPVYDVNLAEPGLNHLSRCEYWIVDRTGGTSNVSVSLAYDSLRSCGVTDLPSLAVARWNGTMWMNHGNGGVSGSLASGTVTTAGPVSTFASPSPFTLASRSTANPLPIVLLYFSAQEEGAHVHAAWATASERDNDHFTVERSVDGADFQRIADLPGAGNSNGILHHGFNDMEPLDGTSYYRLKQTDFNGAFSYSPAVAVVRSGGRGDLMAWPNPATDAVHVQAGNGTAIVQVDLFDMAGRMQQFGSFDPITGTVQLAGVSPGLYVLQVALSNGAVKQLRLYKE